MPLPLCHRMVWVEVIKSASQTMEQSSRVSCADCGDTSKPSSWATNKLYSTPHLVAAPEPRNHDKYPCGTYDTSFSEGRVWQDFSNGSITFHHCCEKEVEIIVYSGDGYSLPFSDKGVQRCARFFLALIIMPENLKNRSQAWRGVAWRWALSRSPIRFDGLWPTT